MKEGDIVVVHPDALGDGLYHTGYITSIEVFLHTTYVTIDFYKQTSDGIKGVTLINLDLIHVLKDDEVANLFQNINW